MSVIFEYHKHITDILAEVFDKEAAAMEEAAKILDLTEYLDRKPKAGRVRWQSEFVHSEFHLRRDCSLRLSC